MTFPTHILAGLLIGKITGDFTTAIVASLVVDLDHFISFYRHGTLFNLRELLRESLDEEDRWGDQRNFMHNVFVWIIISAIISLFNFNVGMVFSAAYLSHLLLDAFNKTYFYPFYPSKRFATKGFIRYNSRQEIIFCAFLILFLSALFIIKI